jgi:hypothetical protein
VPNSDSVVKEITRIIKSVRLCNVSALRRHFADEIVTSRDDEKDPKGIERRRHAREIIDNCVENVYAHRDEYGLTRLLDSFVSRRSPNPDAVKRSAIRDALKTIAESGAPAVPEFSSAVRR